MTNNTIAQDLFTDVAKAELAGCNSLRSLHDTTKSLIKDQQLGLDFEPKRNNAFEMPVGLLKCNLEESIRSEFDEEQIRGMADSYMAGEYVKPLGVVASNGELRIVTGFTSYLGLMLANKEGANIKRVWVVQVESGRATELVRQCVDNQQIAVNALDLAKTYFELMNDHGYTVERIVKEVKRKESHVRKMLALVQVPEEVKQMVDAGQVSVTRALEGVRKCKAEGEDTVIHMQEQLAKAQLNGSNKITAKSTGAPAALYGRKDLDVAAPVLVQLADQLENALPIVGNAPQDVSVTLNISAADVDLKALALALANLRAAVKSAQGGSQAKVKAG